MKNEKYFGRMEGKRGNQDVEKGGWRDADGYRKRGKRGVKEWKMKKKKKELKKRVKEKRKEKVRRKEE